MSMHSPDADLHLMRRIGFTDLHSDLPLGLLKRRFDGREGTLATEWLPRLRAGGVNLVVCAIYIDSIYLPEGALRRAVQLPEDEGTDGIGYGVDYPIFWIDRFHPHSVSQHVAFAAESRAEVESFHAAALRAGGTDNGAPGLREGAYPPGYYAAFVLDPDGNNIEAVFREA